MKLSFKIVIACIILFSLNLYSQNTEKLRLAILDLQSQNIPNTTAIMVSDLLRTELFNTGLFIIIERTEMNTILKEQNFQLTGCTETECAVQVGKLLSANKILVGTVGKLGEKFIINSRIVDVEKGSMDFGEKAEAFTEGDLSRAVENLTDKLAEKIMAVDESIIKTGRQSSKIAELKRRKILGEVIKVSTNDAVISLGSDDGIIKRQQFMIVEPIMKDEISQISGQKITKIRKYENLAKIKIDYIEPNASKGKLVMISSNRNLIGKKLKFMGIPIKETGIRINASYYYSMFDLVSWSQESVNGKKNVEVYYKIGQMDRGESMEFSFGIENYTPSYKDRVQEMWVFLFPWNWQPSLAIKNIDIDGDGLNESLYLIDSAVTYDYFRSKYISFDYSYKPFPEIWYNPLSWLYCGVGVNIGYYQYAKRKTINYGVYESDPADSKYSQSRFYNTESTIIENYNRLGVGVYALIGIYFPPLPDFPVLLNSQLKIGKITSVKELFDIKLTFLGACYRW